MESLDTSTILTLIAVAAGTGILGGVLAGLLGVGGGIVIVPGLYLALSLTDMNPALIMQVAVGTSLSTIIFTSMSSGWGHYKKQSIDFDILKLWAPAILVGVIIGSILGGIVSGYVLIAVFATVALAVAADMIFRNPNPDPNPRSFSKPVWAGFGVFAGAISSMMGIGGGTVCVPILSFLGYDIRKAVGTSAAIGFIIGLPATVIYVISGWNAEGLPPFSVGYVNVMLALLIIPLSATFARVGVAIAHAIPRRALRLCFGFFLFVTAIRMGMDLISGVS